MLYIVSAELNQSDCLTFTRLHLSQKMRHTRSLKWLSVVLALMMLYSFFVLGQRDAFSVALAITFPLLTLTLLFFPRIFAALTWKGIREVSRVEISFGETELTAQTRKGRFTYYYDGLDSLYHTDGMYVIYVGEQSALIVPERSFTLGDPASFRSFLSQKTGLEIMEFRQ